MKHHKIIKIIVKSSRRLHKSIWIDGRQWGGSTKGRPDFMVAVQGNNTTFLCGRVTRQFSPHIVVIWSGFYKMKVLYGRWEQSFQPQVKIVGVNNLCGISYYVRNCGNLIGWGNNKTVSSVRIVYVDDILMADGARRANRANNYYLSTTRAEVCYQSTSR